MSAGQTQDKGNFVKSAYVHIPFCRRRCYYCDFPISVVGDQVTGETSGSIQQYLPYLRSEIRHLPPTSQPSLDTVFFGGGTPSLLSVKQVELILQTLDEQFGINSEAEISMEVDPGTFSLSQLKGYKSAGVNRISLGVQAFQDELLQISGRFHSCQDILTAWEIVQQAGFANYSLDLISGLPTQTLSQWRESLEKAVALDPTHLSCYDLVVEPVTAFGKQYAPGEKPLPSDETTAQMYRLAQEILTGGGYHHYEISNYAKPGYGCRHNQVYWHNEPYYGLGMGAASYTNGQRFSRPRTRREYYQWVEKGCVIDTPGLSENEQLLERLMLGLRLAEGVSLPGVAQRYGEKVVEDILACVAGYRDRVAAPGEHRGWIIVDENQHLRLKDPEGFLFSNTILAALFNCLEEDED
jgi:putative oxygen-independent coproporphyrinogen III oxidase